MTENDPELDALCAVCLASAPGLRGLRWGTRRGLVRLARNVAQAMAAEHGPDAAAVYRETLVQVEAAYAGATDKCGNPILLAVIAAVVQAAVLWVLRRIWPELPLMVPGAREAPGGS